MYWSREEVLKLTLELQKFILMMVGLFLGFGIVYGTVRVSNDEPIHQAGNDEVIYKMKTTARPDCAYLEIVIRGVFDRYEPCSYLKGREHFVGPMLVGSAYVDVDRARRVRAALREQS